MTALKEHAREIFGRMVVIVLVGVLWGLLVVVAWFAWTLARDVWTFTAWLWIHLERWLAWAFVW